MIPSYSQYNTHMISTRPLAGMVTDLYTCVLIQYYMTSFCHNYAEHIVCYIAQLPLKHGIKGETFKPTVIMTGW